MFKVGKKIRVERERFLGVLDIMPVMLSILRSDYHIEWVNRAYCEAFGDNQGHLCFASQFGRDKPCEGCQALIPASAGQPHHWETTFPNGRTFEIYTFPFAGKDGLPMILEMNIDITEQRRAEKERSRLEEQLLQAQKMEAMGVIAGGIAHDFNNLLVAIIGNAELAADKLHEDQPAYYNIKQIMKATLRARELTRGILTFSRQSGKERNPIPLSPVMKETLEFLRVSLPGTIEIRLQIETTEDMVVANPAQIQQVLVNLATNASQAMPDGGLLELSLFDVCLDTKRALPSPDIRPGDYVVICVTDTGCGMDESTRSRIFEPFFTTKDTSAGTGLGLSVVHRIVKSHEGAISVESEPGCGSAFKVFLPKVKTDAKATGEPKSGLPGGTGTLLFVHDQEAIRQTIQSMLMKLGYTVATCPHPSEALDLFSKNPHAFDIVITDQTMPGMTGIELAKHLLAIRRDVPIILTTGFTHFIDEKSAKEAGISTLVMKPLTKEELSRAIKDVLEKKTKA
ncbi:MAG: Wide host range VirA protein [Syntrophorhabdaceae bacterium PtaU1.Bin034]|nr:MAG: Wide host range VirA protein [Syntrophorhabdaceae bacterium PtaU1.Bin034]